MMMLLGLIFFSLTSGVSCRLLGDGGDQKKTGSADDVGVAVEAAVSADAAAEQDIIYFMRHGTSGVNEASKEARKKEGNQAWLKENPAVPFVISGICIETITSIELKMKIQFHIELH